MNFYRLWEDGPFSWSSEDSTGGFLVCAGGRRDHPAYVEHIRGLREDGLPIPHPGYRTVTPRRKTREIDFHTTVKIAA